MQYVNATFIYALAASIKMVLNLSICLSHLLSNINIYQTFH